MTDTHTTMNDTSPADHNSLDLEVLAALKPGEMLVVGVPEEAAIRVQDLVIEAMQHGLHLDALRAVEFAHDFEDRLGCWWTNLGQPVHDVGPLVNAATVTASGEDGAMSVLVLNLNRIGADETVIRHELAHVDFDARLVDAFDEAWRKPRSRVLDILAEYHADRYAARLSEEGWKLDLRQEHLERISNSDNFLDVDVLAARVVGIEDGLRMKGANPASPPINGRWAQLLEEYRGLLPAVFDGEDWMDAVVVDVLQSLWMANAAVHLAGG